MGLRTLITLVWVSLMAVLSGCSSGTDPVASRPAVVPTVPTVPAPVVLAVSLRNDVTAAQQRAIGAGLQSLPDIRTVVFESRDEAWQKAKKVFADRPDLLDMLRPEDFPASFQVTLTDRQAVERVMAAARGMPGVDSVRVTPQPSPSPATTR